MQWLKLHNGAHTDPKWLAVADAAGSSPAVACSTYFTLAEYCSEHDTGGGIAGCEHILRVVAAFNRVAFEEVQRVFSALRDLGLIVADQSLVETRERPESQSQHRKIAPQPRSRQGGGSATFLGIAGDRPRRCKPRCRRCRGRCTADRRRGRSPEDSFTSYIKR